MVPLDLIWLRDSYGYCIETRAPAAISPISILGNTEPTDVIVPLGGDLTPYRPLIKPDLYLRFAQSDSAEALLDFVNEFGLLTREHGAEHVEGLLRFADDLRKLVDALGNRSFRGTVGPVNLEVSLTRDTKTKIRFVPRTLLGGIQLQAMVAGMNGVQVRECRLPTCPERFEVGPNSNPHKHASAVYCCKEHQEKHKSLRRSL